MDITIADCHRYDIEKNLWKKMQKMNQARCFHSSCQLAEHIYVFCGRNMDGEEFNSVEKLSIVDLNRQVSKKWELIS